MGGGAGSQAGGRRSRIPCAVTPPSLGFSAWRPGSQHRGACLAGSCLCCGGHCSGTPALMGRGHPLPFLSTPDQAGWPAHRAPCLLPDPGSGSGEPRPAGFCHAGGCLPSPVRPAGPPPALPLPDLPFAGNQPLRTVDPAEQGEATRPGMSPGTRLEPWVGGGSAVCPAQQAVEGGGVLRNGALPGAPQRQEGAETVWGTPAPWTPQEGTAHSSCPGGAWAAQFTPFPQPSSPSVLPSLGLAPGWHPSPAPGTAGAQTAGAWGGSAPRLSLPRARRVPGEPAGCGAVGSGRGGGLCEGERTPEAEKRPWSVCVRAEPELGGSGGAPPGPCFTGGLWLRTVRQAQVDQDVSCRPESPRPSPVEGAGWRRGPGGGRCGAAAEGGLLASAGAPPPLPNNHGRNYANGIITGVCFADLSA